MANTRVKTANKTEKTNTARKVVKRKKTEDDAPAFDTLNLNAYVPSPDVAKKYVPRMIAGVWDETIAKNARENNRNILLSGDTGAGKTLFGEALASKWRCLYYSVPCDVSIDPSALLGKMVPTDTAGKFEWQDGPVTQVVRHGGVLNISEINFMPPKIAASLYPLLDGRRYVPLLGHKGEVVRAHDDLLVIADMNPNYRGTMELNAAFKNRFDFKIHWGYDEGVESQLISSKSLMDVAKQIRAMVGLDIMTPLSTNMLMEFESFAKDDELGLDFAIHNFVAAFQPDERDAISRVMDLNRTHFARDIGKSLADDAEGDDEELDEIEFEFEDAEN